jgi:hypothetical protein
MMHRLVALVLGGCLTLAWAPAFAGEGGPEPEPALPRYDDPSIPVPIEAAIESKAPPLRPIPWDGRGRLATGGLLVGGGAVALASTVGLAADGAPFKYWGPMFAGGFVGAAVGSVLIVLGHRSLRRYRTWEAGQTESIPAQGYGFAAPAAVLLVGGTFLTLGGGLGWADIMQFRKQYALPAPATPFVIGIAAFVTGATLMGIGSVRSNHFTKWRRATSGWWNAGSSLTPSFGPMRGGAQLGLAGRF